MARNRPRGTLVDYLVAAIEPALIMIMVASLMLFLLDLWYQGPVLERLRWILFWFVFGIVLITRVSMQVGSSLAMGYGVALGGAVALVASVLAGFQPFLLVILGVVWWATHQLTFDCTLLDEDQDAGVGLLQESGLDQSAQSGPIATNTTGSGDPAAMDASLLPRRPWWKIGERDSNEAGRPHAPGHWLVYFTLASLPLFGLGQWFVPAVEEERRAGLFLYFLAYIASGMGLLLTTSFLNLRRYLRQRKVRMPAAMTATWLSTGAILIVGLTALAAVLPLPLSGWSVVRGATRESTDLRASRLAMLKDSGVQGEGAPSEGPAASKAAQRPSASGKAKGSGQTNDPNAAQQTSGKGRPGGESGPGRSKSGAPRGQSSPSQAGTQGKQGSPQDQAGDQGKSQDGRSENQADRAKGANPDQAGNQGKSQDGRSENQADRGKDAGQDSHPEDQKASEPNDEKSSSSQENPDARAAANPSSRLPSLSFQAPSWLRPLIIAAGVVALIFGLFRYGRAMFQALCALLASLLGGLFIAQRQKPAKDAPAASEPAAPPRPFASFVNPFDNGLVQRFSPDDLVIYSFEALEAWAWEHNLARAPHETPIEFVHRLGQARADLRPDATRLVRFFVTIVYGQRGFQAEVLPALRQFWRSLQSGPA
jgi:hypothetical protein